MGLDKSASSKWSSRLAPGRITGKSTGSSDFLTNAYSGLPTNWTRFQEQRFGGYQTARCEAQARCRPSCIAVSG